VGSLIPAQCGTEFDITFFELDLIHTLKVTYIKQWLVITRKLLETLRTPAHSIMWI
jgi:hypothetical protein